MRIHLLSLSTLLVLFSCEAPHRKAPPLVDGSCAEYEDLSARSINISDDVTLNLYQDDHYVWLCYCYPEGSYGILDMEIASPGLTEPLNLHVSAQLGEWPLDNPELQPQDAQSDLWWNHKGWTANEVWPNGMDRSGETARPLFKNALARELQMSKDRFGRGEWKLKLSINAVQTDSGFVRLKFPEDDSSLILQVN